MLTEILDFDDRGNITPYQTVELNLGDCYGAFVQNFVLSLTRRDLYENLVQYRLDVFESVGATFPQWLDGSFVTQKSDPEDIDLVNLIPFDTTLDHKIESLLPYFTVGGSLEKYKIDAHLIPVYPKSDPRAENMELRKTYFKRWFGHDREGHPKGFITITEP